MQKNRFKSNWVVLALQRLIAIDRVFITTLGVSILLHLLLLILVLNTELPTVSQEDYAKWVTKIAEPNREAIILPVDDMKPFEGDVAEGAAGSGTGKGTPGGGGGRKGGGSGGGSGGVRQAVSGSGVLGVIGVASEGGGQFGDVFSSSSGSVSDDVGAVMEGKQGANVASSGSIGRKQLGGGGNGTGDGDGSGDGSGGGGAAGIGQVGIAAGGRVNTGKKAVAEIKGHQIGMADASVLSGGLDKKAASAVIARKSSGFRRCYERGLKSDTGLQGKLVFEISIGGDGSVLDVRFVENTIHSKEVSDCVKSILMRLVFPKSENGIAILRNTLVFEPQQ